MKAKKILKMLLITGAVLIPLFFILKYIYFDTGAIPESTNYFADIAEIRKLAQADTSELPTQINSLKVGEGDFPAWLVIAGGGGKESYIFHFRTFQVMYPETSIIIDPVHAPEAHKAFEFATKYSKANFDAVQQAMLRADEIICTHEHWDHIGGISQSPHYDKIKQKVMLTPEQVNSEFIAKAVFPEGGLAEIHLLEYEKYHLLAPGMVLIKSPGHTQGSQMIFLKLKNGQEYIFIGDVVWNMDNINKLTGHSRLVSWIFGEDRKQQFGQIRWLYNLQKEGKVKIITAHDPVQHQKYIREGVFSDILE